ncbi:MAG: hypothetical protein J6L86_01690 [Alphaproteobacteria bacterium]|nr:hypothetical protein [Alphaproteobacteria bacterium]
MSNKNPNNPKAFNIMPPDIYYYKSTVRLREQDIVSCMSIFPDHPLFPPPSETSSSATRRKLHYTPLLRKFYKI